MTLPELSAYLVAEGIGTANVTIFEDFMPPTPNSCVTIREYGGRADVNVRAFGQAEMTREFPRVQILVRGEPDDYTTPRVKAQDVMRAMTRIMSVTLSGIEYYTSTPIQSVFPLMRDEVRRYVFAFNVELFKQVSVT
jgi:hypothetical protein